MKFCGHFIIANFNYEFVYGQNPKFHCSEQGDKRQNTWFF